MHEAQLCTASSQILQKSMFIQLNDAKKVKPCMLLYRHQRGQKAASEKGRGAFQCFISRDMLKIKTNKIYCYKTNKNMFRQTLHQRSVVLSRQRSFNCFYCEAFHWLWRKTVHRHIYGCDLVHVLLLYLNTQHYISDREGISTTNKKNMNHIKCYINCGDNVIIISC